MEFIVLDGLSFSSTSPSSFSDPSLVNEILVFVASRGSGVDKGDENSYSGEGDGAGDIFMPGGVGKGTVDEDGCTGDSVITSCWVCFRILGTDGAADSENNIIW
uniref:Uncharacterized protein n=1 Tax=Rhizophora mucronata TaxID=61149 RepID=A0A2P2PCK4_RHIMU